MAKRPHPEVEVGSWAETRNPFPFDTMLREVKFKILSRPNKGTPLWIRNGKVYTERDALLARKEELFGGEKRGQ